MDKIDTTIKPQTDETSTSSPQLENVVKPILHLLTQVRNPALETLSLQLWNKYTEGRWDVRLIECNSYEDGLISCLAIEEPSTIITCVDVTTMPVHPLCDGDLMVVKSFPFNDARRAEFAGFMPDKVKYYIPTGLPISYSKDLLSSLLVSPMLNNPAWQNVNVPTIYQIGIDVIPFNASIADTNVTGLVARRNPNPEVVKSYFAERKFVMVTGDGFEAIKHLLAELVE